MKEKGGTRKRVIRLIVLSMVCHLILGSALLFGYDIIVHEEITSKAIDNSLLDVRLKQLGFGEGVEYKLGLRDVLKAPVKTGMK